MKQTCILILGMHRSGTSALAGVLSLLDIYLGSKLMPANESNEKGYFENNILYNINEKLLAKIGSSWDDVFFREDKLLGITEVKELKEQIEKEFQYSDIFAIKDPRLAFLFPVYQKVLDEMGIDIKVIIPYRNPIEVANSLSKRNEFPHEKAMILWSYHVLLAEKFSRDYKRVFIEFNELINNTKNSIRTISKELDIPLTSKYKKNKKLINEFLEPSLKHHNLSIDNLSSNLPKIVKEILDLKDDFNDKTIFNKFDYLREELFDYQKLFYSEDIVQTFLELEQNRKILTEKEQTIVQKDKALTQTKESLTQTQENAEKIKQALEQNRKILTEKEQAIVQKDKELTQTKESLTQTQHNAEKIKQALEQNRKTLTEKEQTIVQKDKALTQTKESLTQTQHNAEKIKQALEQNRKTLTEKGQTIVQKNKELAQTQQNLEKNTQVLKNTELALAEALKQIEELKDEIVVIYTERGCEITRFLKKIKKAF
ncbi:MAG: hypothetical protein COB07_12665 [Sulfurovum sp.]|nr:MAG: hypothetical protein COB07_12665 [Sulfurovum sp.]